MRIAVLGAGGIGGYYGARLAEGGADVALIARGEHLAALRRDGLHLRSPLGDEDLTLPATDAPWELGEVDAVLVTVKSQDTRDAAQMLEPLVGPSTAVVSLQNGLGNEELLAETVGAEHVLGGVCYLLATIREPGVIEHVGGPATVVFGELAGGRSERAEALHHAFVAGGVDARVSEDVRVDLWTKFSFIVALAGMTAATRLPIGTIRSSPPAWELFRRLLREVAAVAAAEGVELDDEVLARHEQLAHDFEPDVRSSLHHDLSHGKPLELDALHGELLRRARAHGVDVPVTEVVHGLLAPFADGGPPR